MTPEILYVIYDVTNKKIDLQFDVMYEATMRLNLVREIYPNNKYQLIVYRRCMVCDT